MVVPDKRMRKIAYGLHFDQGFSAAEIRAKAMPTYSLRTVQLLLKDFRLNFSWEQPARRKSKWDLRLNEEGLAHLRDIIQDNPGLYLDEIKRELREAHGVRASRSTICRAIHEPISHGGLGMSLLVMESRAIQQDGAERARFRARMARGDFDHRNCIVIDEASVGRNHARRRRGYGTRGRRVVFHDVFGKFNNGTLMAACDCDGFVRDACEFIPYTMDSERFVQWVRDGLCPVLGNYVAGEPRSVVVLDNVAQHHDPRVVELIEAAGAICLYLPRYSPDFSPIELGFAHLKKALQNRSLHPPQSEPEFEERLRACMDDWKPVCVRGCFRKCLFDVPAMASGEEEEEAVVAALLIFMAAEALRA